MRRLILVNQRSVRLWEGGFEILVTTGERELPKKILNTYLILLWISSFVILHYNLFT